MTEAGGLSGPLQDAATVIRAFLAQSGAPWREVAAGEWGVRLETSGGWPLDAGLRLSRGYLRVQAEVLGAGRADPHALLHHGRAATLARFTETAAGVVWVQGELPLGGLDAGGLDVLLGAVLEAAQWARAAGSSAPG